MHEPQFSKGKFSSFITGKGFYAILAICLVGAGVAAWGAADRTLSNIRDSNEQIIDQGASEEEISWTFPEQEAAKPDTTVPKSSGLPSSSLQQEPSSPEPDEPTEPSEQQVLLPKRQTSAYSWPVKGRVIAGFSAGELVKNETLKVWRTHDGVDLAAEKGAAVVATAAGTVIDVRDDPLWGVVVEIEHAQEIVSITAGLDKDVKVKKGDTVKQGQALGTVFVVPAEQLSPSHIHFAIKQKGKFIDPATLVK